MKPEVKLFYPITDWELHESSFSQEIDLFLESICLYTQNILYLSIHTHFLFIDLLKFEVELILHRILVKRFIFLLFNTL